MTKCLPWKWSGWEGADVVAPVCKWILPLFASCRLALAWFSLLEPSRTFGTTSARGDIIGILFPLVTTHRIILVFKLVTLVTTVLLHHKSLRHHGT